jgi:IPT/TIG domain
LPAVSAPLPYGTRLTIEEGSWICFIPNPGQPETICSRIRLEPGRDGGIIVGKNQRPGGQEIQYTKTGNQGEMAYMPDFFTSDATLFTAPVDAPDCGNSGVPISIRTDATLNTFDDASCSDAACLGKTVLGALHIAGKKCVGNMGTAHVVDQTGKCIALDKKGNCLLNSSRPGQDFVTNWVVAADGKYMLDYRWPGAHELRMNKIAVPWRIHLEGRIERLAVSGFRPDSGDPGTMIRVYGMGFEPDGTTVTINQVAVPLVNVHDQNQLSFKLPPRNTNGRLCVRTSKGERCSEGNFGVRTAVVAVTGIWPSEAKLHDTVYVFGSGFDKNTKIKLAGRLVLPVTREGDGLLQFSVPKGARTGTIQLISPHGSATSAMNLHIVQ